MLVWRVILTLIGLFHKAIICVTRPLIVFVPALYAKCARSVRFLNLPEEVSLEVVLLTIDAAVSDVTAFGTQYMKINL